MPFGAILPAEVLGIRGRSNDAVLNNNIARVINWINMLYKCLVKVYIYFDICKIYAIKLVRIILHHPV